VTVDPVAAAFDAMITGLDAPLVIVTTSSGGERAGCLVGFHSQSSIAPRRAAVWLSKANRTYRVALRASHVAVHALTVADGGVAAHFGGETGDEVDKFAGLAWSEGPGGVPLLAACPHRVVLARVTLLDEGGDHVLLTGAPVLAESPGAFTPLRLGDVEGHIRPGHPAEGA
jgi:flavin reductase (DIM6/NTAB) family NADH-FMN oxidoreductase RutF